MLYSRQQEVVHSGLEALSYHAGRKSLRWSDISENSLNKRHQEQSLCLGPLIFRDEYCTWISCSVTCCSQWNLIFQKECKIVSQTHSTQQIKISLKIRKRRSRFRIPQISQSQGQRGFRYTCFPAPSQRRTHKP